MHYVAKKGGGRGGDELMTIWKHSCTERGKEGEREKREKTGSKSTTAAASVLHHLAIALKQQQRRQQVQHDFVAPVIGAHGGCGLLLCPTHSHHLVHHPARHCDQDWWHHRDGLLSALCNRVPSAVGQVAPKLWRAGFRYQVFGV